MVPGSRRGKLQTQRQGLTRDFPRLLGERLCLHFANTIEDPSSDYPQDFLHGYADLVRWSWHAQALDEGPASELRELAEADPDEARVVFERALGLRAAIDGVFRTIARGKEPARDDLQTIQDEYLDAVRVASLVRVDDHFGWSWKSERDLRRVLWPVVESAVEVLTQGDLTRVNECPGTNDCGWLFYDTSRNRTRRWCSMEGCGSRAKMRRYYARSRHRPHEPFGGAAASEAVPASENAQ
jgi:predicted RNA-binding Zn ribbon-like protein